MRFFRRLLFAARARKILGGRQTRLRSCFRRVDRCLRARCDSAAHAPIGIVGICRRLAASYEVFGVALIVGDCIAAQLVALNLVFEQANARARGQLDGIFLLVVFNALGIPFDEFFESGFAAVAPLAKRGQLARCRDNYSVLLALWILAHLYALSNCSHRALVQDDVAH